MSDNFNQLNDRELIIGYWWTRFRVQIKAGFTMILIVIIGFIFLNAGRMFYNYFITSPKYENMLTELAKNRINYAQIRQLTGPKNLQIKLTKALSGQSVGFYDIVSELENTNQNWWIQELIYQFSIDGELTDEQTVYILPREKKYLHFFNYKSSTAPKSLRLILKRELWRRVKDPLLFDSRGRFQTPEMKVSDVRLISGVSGLKNSEVQFNLTNNTSYGLWTVEATVLLKQSDAVRVFNIFTVEKVKPSETRNIKVNMGNISTLGLYPEIIISANIIDQRNIMDSEYDLPATNIR